MKNKKKKVTRARRAKKQKAGTQLPIRRIAEAIATTTRRKQKRVNTQRRIAGVFSRMRSGSSLRQASREIGISPRTVLRQAATGLRKNKSGRYRTKTSDRLVLLLMIPTLEGPQEISVRGLRAASLLGRYWVAVHK